VSDQRLWAPWRLEYIQGPKTGECIFCAKPDEGDDEAALIVWRGQRSFVMLNAYPYNNGHVMVSPFDHVATIEELPDQTLLELMNLSQLSLAALRTAYSPEGFNLGINQGRIAGAGFEQHVHLHVVPRWAADTNFMPAIGATRVLPQSLADSRAALRQAFEHLTSDQAPG
jgi:ATP adenylyltransferase